LPKRCPTKGLHQNPYPYRAQTTKKEIKRPQRKPTATPEKKKSHAETTPAKKKENREKTNGTERQNSPLQSPKSERAAERLRTLEETGSLSGKTRWNCESGERKLVPGNMLHESLIIRVMGAANHRGRQAGAKRFSIGKYPNRKRWAAFLISTLRAVGLGMSWSMKKKSRSKPLEKKVTRVDALPNGIGSVWTSTSKCENISFGACIRI
jgi:hypothetical protein